MLNSFFGLESSNPDGTSSDTVTSTIRPSKGNFTSDDQSSEHDEVCNVCDSGGDLLCCDTCTSVFHLHCLYPKLTAVPRGRWSCHLCIMQVDLLINFFVSNFTVFVITFNKIELNSGSGSRRSCCRSDRS